MQDEEERNSMRGGDRLHPPEIRPRDGLLPTHATAGAFMVRGGRLLLEKRPDDARVYRGMWDTPGGHIEGKETPEAALVREMKEELSIQVSRFFLGMAVDDLEPASGIFYRHFIYIVTSWEGEVVSREGRVIRWHLLEEVPGLPSLNPLVAHALGCFRDRGWLAAQG